MEASKEHLQKLVLAKIFYNPETFNRSRIKLKSEHFEGNYRILFDAIKEEVSENKKPDFLRVINKCNQGVLFSECLITCATDANLEFHSACLIENNVLSNFISDLYDVGKNITSKYDKHTYINEFVERTQNLLEDLNIQIVETFKDSINNRLKDKQIQQESNLITYVPTNINEFDLKLDGGFQKSDLIVFAARPSMGKTAFTLFLSKFIATSSNLLFFSLEMTKQRLIDRLLLSETNITSYNYKTANLASEDWQKLEAASNIINNLKMNIIDDIYDITEICRMIKNIKPEIVVIDYLQLIRGFDDVIIETQRIGKYTKELKRVCKLNNIPIIILAQLNRENTKESNKRPKLEHLAGSKEIENDSDLICFLHREDYYHKSDENYENNNILEIINEKNRDGITFKQNFIVDAFFRNFTPTENNNLQIFENMNNNENFFNL